MEMMKKLFTIIICICAVTAQAQKPNNEALRKLQMAEFAITNLYVDKVDEDKLVEEAIIKMLAQLDPHSTYNDDEEVKKMNEPLQGNFEGIGVQFQMIEDTLLVIQPVSNGPSEKVGILAGDRIVAVNDSAIAGVKMSTEDIMSRLRGPKDSEVKLTIVRRGVDDQLYFTVKRDKIPILSLDASYMIQPKTGYIRINRFGATTAEEFAVALKSLQKKGMKDLILDLEENGGGYLMSAVQIANEFLRRNDLIVYTKGRNTQKQEYRAQGDGKLLDGKVIVLINEYTASAAEIVTGAIQDQDRGEVVGRRSFGKGLVQREMPLGDGSAVRLTVARYYTPSGRSIQKPYEDKAENYFNEFEKRFESGELYEKDKTKIADSLKFKTKKGRTVYGGGGIIPDVFVPFEGKHGEEMTTLMLQSGFVNYFVFEQIDKNRNKFANMSIEEIKKEVHQNDNYFNAFKKHIATSGLMLNLDNQKEKTLHYIHAEFVHQLFDEKQYYQLLLKEDLMLNKVLNR